MNAADRLALLEVNYDIHIGLTPDGKHLDVDGPSLTVQVAEPMLRQHRDSLLTYLRKVAARDAPEVRAACTEDPATLSALALVFDK